ncbi:hypothetical protein JFT64_18675 [Pseudomonas carnis]|jgi:hypothetical protein|uniref:hypothetical protein n=1 Tax=Pseudomonas carnis TaxID=2487355 RepID=UPI0018E791CD|nr:hypothetical protein [Pseudomonas carnis]MBJ2214070.1 hypothetical protein [Pseudomonas carnis]
MTTHLTDDQLADAAVKIVLASLPYKRELMEQMGMLDLPIMGSDGIIQGYAADNAAVFTTYGPEWTGLAVGSAAGRQSYWFVYHCEDFQERAIVCLGNQPSVAAAIIEAAMQVKANLKHWRCMRKAA